MSDHSIVAIPEGSVTSPQGFLAGGTYAGLKTYGEDKLDLAILYSDSSCSVAGVFTKNLVTSPTVPLTRRRTQGGQAQAVIVNSGCANACVGPQGMLDAVEMGALAARKLGTPEEEILVASTGVIGVELPMALVRSGVDRIELSKEGGHVFARAIMTTDSRRKEATVRLELGGRECTIAAASKGVGMIHPNMATMLCFMTTDAAVEPGFLRSALQRTADRTFNMLTIDGDTSTNDMVLVLANGRAGNAVVRAESDDAETFEAGLHQVASALTRMTAGDGEGATKVLEAMVEDARSLEDARTAARSIVRSPLFKSAVHGGDPNWGRVLSAIGSSGALVEEEKVTLYINGICMMDKGVPVPFFKDAAVLSMQGAEIKVLVRLGLGEHGATAWGCDLTEDYVRLNSEYTT